MSLKSIVKKLVPGIAWQNPAINLVLRCADPVDYVLRRLRGLQHLPRYSIRVRSNGFTGQFGGDRFAQFGRKIAQLLTEHAQLTPASVVLEIGCGCGRGAFALAETLRTGRYTGMDIEPTVLETCRENRFFKARQMQFDLLDVQNDEYNPNGQFRADNYQFPYRDASFDVIYLVSVFTHMLTADVQNYIAEISRMLRPGGACMITTYLVDHGIEGNVVRFPLQDREHYFQHEHMPEIAVAYEKEFYIREFEQQQLDMDEPLWGIWRRDSNINSQTGFGQDILVARKS